MATTFEHSVLIIDDDPWMQRVFSRILIAEGFKKYYLASNGYEGLALAIEHKPTLILLDIIMPDLNGCQILKMIKYIKMLKNIPVIIASAAPNPTSLGVSIKLGAAGFIVKPFTSTTVHEKLIQVFGEEGLSLIQKGKQLDIPIHSDHLEEFDIEQQDAGFELENFKMKQQNVEVIPDSENNEKSGKTNVIDKNVLRVHYQTDKEENAKLLDEMLNNFKYKD